MTRSFQDDGFLFVAAAGDGSCIAVLTRVTADIGPVAHETARAGENAGAGRLVGHVSLPGRPGNTGRRSACAARAPGSGPSLYPFATPGR